MYDCLLFLPCAAVFLSSTAIETAWLPERDGVSVSSTVESIMLFTLIPVGAAVPMSATIIANVTPCSVVGLLRHSGCPRLHAWQDSQHPVRLVEQSFQKGDSDPKALACYGVLWQEGTPQEPKREQMWLRFVTGRPVSAITTQFLDWCCQGLLKDGKTHWLLIWDNASWHKSQIVRTWIRQHNQQVKQTGVGVRILPFLLPTQSPWLNPIEPKWVHGKRNVVETDGLLTAKELAERVCAYYGTTYEPHLVIPEKVA